MRHNNGVRCAHYKSLAIGLHVIPFQMLRTTLNIPDLHSLPSIIHIFVTMTCGTESSIKEN